MGLESSFNFIDDLNSTNPAAGDNISEGDDHIRGIKNAVKGSFTSLGSVAVTKTAAEINDLVDKSSAQTISGAKTFSADVTIDKATPALSLKPTDEATEDTVIIYKDDLNNFRAVVYRPAGLDKLRLDVRDVSGVVKAALDITEAGGIDVAVGTFSATSAALTTPALTNATGSLISPVLNTSVSGTAFLDEDDMVSDSATKLSSQQSIKAYVDRDVVTPYAMAIAGPATISAQNKSGITLASGGTGIYTFTHNFGSLNYTAHALIYTLGVINVQKATNTFTIFTANLAGTAVNTSFDLLVHKW